MLSTKKKKPDLSVVKNKSGIRSLKPGEVLFNENDMASSLYIIQTGQIRLYLPKGRGFVEIAILRAGEVIGEMSYFDEKSRVRSCSAAAIVTTAIIEISFQAFGKTMSGLNPWFKTIINTLADRLRKTNTKVKELETNSVSFGKGGRVADYTFFHSTDVVKFFSLFYLIMKTHGDIKEGGMHLHMSKFKFYALDIFNYPEIKYEEFIQLMTTKHFISIGMDQDNLPRVFIVPNIERIRNMLLFFNTQRMTADDKKLIISEKCETFLGKIIAQLEDRDVKSDTAMAVADLSKILLAFKKKKTTIGEEDLSDAVKAGLVDDLMVGEGNVITTDVHFAKLKKIFPSIRMMNAISKINEEKSQTSKY